MTRCLYCKNSTKQTYFCSDYCEDELLDMIMDDRIHLSDLDQKYLKLATAGCSDTDCLPICGKIKTYLRNKEFNDKMIKVIK